MHKKKGIIYILLTTIISSFLLLFLVSNKSHAFNPFDPHVRYRESYEHKYGEENYFEYVDTRPWPTHPTPTRFYECVRLLGNRTFCSCLNNNLPAAVSFRDYKNMLLTDRRRLIRGGDYGPRSVVSKTFRVRKKCIQYSRIN